MTKKFKNIYIEISKLGVFPALLKKDTIYLTTNTMDRVALIYNNSIYCKATINKDGYKLSSPMNEENIPIIEVPKEFETPLIKKIIKVPKTWSYEIISEEKYLQKNREKRESYQERYNETLDRLTKELLSLQTSTPKFCHNERIGVEELKEFKQDIEIVIEEIERLKL